MNKIEDFKSNNGERGLNVESKSQLSLKTLFYSWTLSDISKCLGFSSATVYSPEFDFGDASWRLALNTVSNDNNLNEIKIRPCKTEKGGTGYFLKYKISLFVENGSFATQEAQSKFEGDNILGHRLVFKREDNMDILDAALKSDGIIIHCEFLVLSTVTCEDSPGKPLTPDNKVAAMKKVKEQKTSELTPSKLYSKRILKRLTETRSDKRDKHFFLVIFLFCIVMLMPTLPPKQSLHNHGKEINDLVISTTLKVINIAHALNLTEVKIKSVDFLRFYYKDYNISDLELLNANFSDVFSELDMPNDQEPTKQIQTEAEKPILHK